MIDVITELVSFPALNMRPLALYCTLWHLTWKTTSYMQRFIIILADIIARSLEWHLLPRNWSVCEDQALLLGWAWQWRLYFVHDSPRRWVSECESWQTAEDVGTEPARAAALSKLGLAPNEGFVEEPLEGNSLGWRNPDLFLFKKSNRKMGVSYKGTGGKIRRPFGNASLLDWKAWSFWKSKGLIFPYIQRKKKCSLKFPHEAREESCGKAFPEGRRTDHLVC